MAPYGTEVERKFLVVDVPSTVDSAPALAVRQGYLAVCREAEVRIRDAGGEYTLTVKSGHGIERAETEIPLTAAQFEQLWPATAGHRIEKLRVRLALEGGLVAELDLYGGALEGLKVVEVEFASRADAAAFVPPPWFGEDVSEDRRYKNAVLASSGMPQDDTARAMDD